MLPHVLLLTPHTLPPAPRLPQRFDAGCLGKVTRHVAFPEVVDLGPFLTPRGGAAGGGAGAGGGGAAQNGTGVGAMGRSRSAVDLSHTHTHRANGTDGEGGSQHHHHPGPHPSHSHDGSRPHPHAHHASPSGGTAAGAASSPSSPPQAPSRSLYTLTGVLVHQGASLHGGHYYALVRDSQVGCQGAQASSSRVAPAGLAPCGCLPRCVLLR